LDPESLVPSSKSLLLKSSKRTFVLLRTILATFCSLRNHRLVSKNKFITRFLIIGEAIKVSVD